MALLSAGDVFPLPKARYGIAISWDHAANAQVDVDLQAVAIDDQGRVIDAVYYNNLKALGCITHSGDEQSGKKTGFDESVWVRLEKAPDNLRIIVFVVAAHRNGHLRDAVNGKVHILEETPEKEVASFLLERSEEEVDVVGMCVKEGGAWKLHLLNEPAKDGKHFIDILEPTIGDIVRRIIPGAPKRLKVAFAMEKGSVVDLSQSSSVKEVKAALGWQTEKGKVDLDVSAVLFNSSAEAVDACFFGNQSVGGLQHSGDDLTGEGDGDDEIIRVNFQAVPDWAQQIFFCVNIYTQGKSFANVSAPYCRILDGSTELARYELREAGTANGLVIARLFREPSGRWGFQAIGSFCKGQTWKDSVPDIQEICKKTPRELQLRGASAASLGSGPAAPPVAAPLPAQAGQDGCCTLQ